MSPEWARFISANLGPFALYSFLMFYLGYLLRHFFSTREIKKYEGTSLMKFHNLDGNWVLVDKVSMDNYGIFHNVITDKWALVHLLDDDVVVIGNKEEIVG